MKLPITAIILTYNEEINLPHCLDSIADWVEKIIIVDCGSMDKTIEIARRYGAEVVTHEFKNQAQQFNWALDNLQIKTEWILRLDADERMTEELWREIAGKLPKALTDVTGFSMKRRVYFMGRWIKHGGYYPVWFLRLARTSVCRYEEREVDEHMILFRGKAATLENDFIDENKKDLAWWISKHNDYSSKEVRERIKAVPDGHVGKLEGGAAQKRKMKNFYLRLPLFWRAFGYFIYRYIFKLGFLDGKEGLIFHFLQGCWNQFIVDAKLYEYEKRNKKRD